MEHFLAQQNVRHGVSAPVVDRAAMLRMRAYEWPSNVRELEHGVSRARVLSAWEWNRGEDTLRDSRDSYYRHPRNAFDVSYLDRR